MFWLDVEVEVGTVGQGHLEPAQGEGGGGVTGRQGVLPRVRLDREVQIGKCISNSLIKLVEGCGGHRVEGGRE